MRNNRSYKKSFFLYFLLFGILVEAITITIIFALNYFDIKDKIQQKYQLQRAEKVNMLQHLTNQSQNSIFSLIKNGLFKEYVLKNDEKNRQTAINLFDYILDENTNYMQVRYIDKNGHELIRVDRDKNKVIQIAKKDLQDKSQRYYFKDTMKTKNDTFWHSNIDLNIENKKIQIPYNPTFRVAKKVIYDGKIKGMLIVNISMEKILKQLIKSLDFDITLVDEEGYVIYSSFKDKSWARDLNKNNTFFEENGINKEALKHHSYHNGELFIEKLSGIFLSKNDMYLVFKNRGVMVDLIKKSNYYATLWVMILVFLISIPIAFFMSNIPTKLYDKLVKSLYKIKEFSQIIDKYVMSLSVDEEGHIKETSTAFAKKSNYDKSEIIGQKHEDIILHAKKDDKESSTLKNGEMLAKDKDGTHFWVEQTVSPLKGTRGDLKGYASILFDITEKKEVKKQALTDFLTSLPNRRCLNEFLEREFELSKRYGTIFSVFILDIDFFKNINDTYGHIFGDKVLQEIANIMLKHIRNTDMIGRFGGEEFLAVLPYTEIQGAIITAENFRQEIEEFDFGCKVTASFGVTSYVEGDDIKSLLKRADEALYSAKKRGRNNVKSG